MHKLKILIVDDEVDYCQIMKSYFIDKNHDTYLAYTLKDGISLLETASPDILFLDNNLPDGQGWLLVDEIVEKYPHLKIFLVSAYRQKSDIANTSSNINVWEKPISLSTLDEVFK